MIEIDLYHKHFMWNKGGDFAVMKSIPYAMFTHAKANSYQHICGVKINNEQS